MLGWTVRNTYLLANAVNDIAHVHYIIHGADDSHSRGTCSLFLAFLTFGGCHIICLYSTRFVFFDWWFCSVYQIFAERSLKVDRKKKQTSHFRGISQDRSSRIASIPFLIWWPDIRYSILWWTRTSTLQQSLSDYFLTTYYLFLVV